MTTQAKVTYTNGEEEVFTITHPTAEVVDRFLHLGSNLLINAEMVSVVEIYEDVPEPDVETELTVEIPATDKYDDEKDGSDEPEETQLDRIERLVKEWGEKAEKPVFPLPNTAPWTYPNTIPNKPWIISNGSNTYATGGVVKSEESVPAELKKGETIEPLISEKSSPFNIYVQTVEGMNPDDIAKEVARQLEWSSTEIGERLEKLAEPLTSDRPDTCRCEEDSAEVCPDHPYGYYL